ncbi:MAG: LuxR C-terminal-related transcriptional regulator [Coriobacteriales bacterium]|jgi:DNA-binding CsgD family transcriptional regulator|nr:LuxR C-terminal-related transcriptional regulator [Coriobacteriales bacterium]
MVLCKSRLDLDLELPMSGSRSISQPNIFVAGIGLGLSFDLYGVCLWGGAQLFAGTVDGSVALVYVIACLTGSLVGFLAKPLARLLRRDVGPLYRQGMYVSGILGMALLLLSAWRGVPPFLLGAGLLVGFTIAALFMFWVGDISRRTPGATRKVLALSMVFSAALNALFYGIDPLYLLPVMCPVLILASLALCWRFGRTGFGKGGLDPSVGTHAARQGRPHPLKRSLQELTAPAVCAVVLLLVVPTINYVALEDCLEWRSRFLLIASAQLLAAVVLFVLLGVIKRGPLMVTAFVGAAPLLAVALFLFPFLGTAYQYALLLTGSFLHFIVTALLMADSVKVAARQAVDPQVLYGPLGALTFLVTYGAAQVMDSIVRSGISRDIQMVATAFFLVYLFGVVFLFVQNLKRERERQEAVEDNSVISTLKQKDWRWGKDGREAECCRFIRRRYDLSERETEVLEKLLHGKNAPAIAEELVISPNTVRSHIKRLYRALGVHSRQELIESFEELLDEFVR